MREEQIGAALPEPAEGNLLDSEHDLASAGVVGQGRPAARVVFVGKATPVEAFDFDLDPLAPFTQRGLGNALLLMGFVAIAGLVVCYRNKKDSEVLWYAYFLTGLLMILMPASLHPWYLILIIPFLTVFPNVAWLVFSGTVSLSYLKYASPQGIMPAWVLLTEYLPLFAFLAAGYLLKRHVHRHKISEMDIRRKKEEIVKVQS